MAVVSFPEAADYPRLDAATLARLRTILAQIRSADIFRGVVIAANSRSFATGAEIDEVSNLSGVAAREFALSAQALFNSIEQFPVPVVAAIRGYCLGGGLDLALACHARVAAFDASFGHPGATLGLMTGWGATQRLPRRVGKAAALEMFLTAQRLPATQALTLGLVDELAASQDLIVTAARHAARLAMAHAAGPLAESPARAE